MGPCSNKRTCGKSEKLPNYGGYASTVFSVHNAPYKKVHVYVGKLLGIKAKNWLDLVHQDLHHALINETYVDGMSITHGHHIWTFAAASGGSISQLAITTPARV